MVSSKVVAPAVYGSWVELDRNYCINPRPSVFAGSGWQSIGGSIDGEWVVYTAPAAVVGYIFAAPFEEALVAGDVVTFSAIVRNDDPGITHLRFAPRTNAYLATNPIPTPPGVEVEATVTYVVTAPIAAGVLHLSVVPSDAAGTFQSRPIGSSFRVRRPRYNRGSVDLGFYDGNTPSGTLEGYAWTGAVGGSASARSRRILITPEQVAPVYETVTLTSASDSITFRALPEAASGFVYDNETLERWYALPSTDPKVNKRPNAHGAFGLGQVFAKEAKPLIAGQYYGTSSADAKAARRRLSAMFADGFPVTMSVTDEDGYTETRTVTVADFSAPFTADFSHFTFDIETIATDPRRYGATASASTDMPTASSGLVWNLGSAPSGRFFEWGTPGNPGIVTFTNTGGSATYPRLEVGGPGNISGGFRITEIETGRELIYTRTITSGQIVVLDSRTERASLGTGDVTAGLSKRQWFRIPAGATRRYQITPLGPYSGAPAMTLYTASANL